MSGLPEQVIIIVFSLHLGEFLALAMLSFISLPYTVLYHDFQFFCLIALVSSYQAGNLVILDTMTGCSSFSFFLGIFMFFLMFSLALGSMEFLIDSMP